MTGAFSARRRRRLREATCPAAAVLSDTALLESMRGPASRAALQELFHRHGAAVHRLVTLVMTDPQDVDRVVEDVFVALSRGSGRLEDDVENVRLGLLAMALRRSRQLAAAGDHSGRPGLRALPNGSGDALALTVLAAAKLTDVAAVLQADRRVVAIGLRRGLLAASGPGRPLHPVA